MRSSSALAGAPHLKVAALDGLVAALAEEHIAVRKAWAAHLQIGRIWRQPHAIRRTHRSVMAA